MNELSRQLYMADVVDAANDLFAFMAFICAFAAAAGIIAYFAAASDGVKLSRWLPIAPPIAFLVFSLGAVLTPSKDTIYAIAASEMGEKAINTPTAQKAFKALNAWLDRQIEGPSKSEAEAAQ